MPSAALSRTPGMGTDLEVKVLSRAGHSEGREA